ncbi:MAG: hypothetical protein ISR74_06765 [Candidatus Thioglobus sp.]|nr:hypothetical protein [Candidatus Thioglobus sp.]
MSIKSDALNRLFNAFPAKKNEDREKLYRSWADKTDHEVVDRVVDFCIGEDATFPKLSRLYSLSRDYIAERSIGQPEADCWFCDSTGLVPGIYQDRQKMWTHGIISACKCTNGHRKVSKDIPLLIFEHDPKYIDLMKVGKKHKQSPWGAIPYFYMELRGAGLMNGNANETNLHSSITQIVEG